MIDKYNNKNFFIILVLGLCLKNLEASRQGQYNDKDVFLTEPAIPTIKQNVLGGGGD